MYQVTACLPFIIKWQVGRKFFLQPEDDLALKGSEHLAYVTQWHCLQSNLLTSKNHPTAHLKHCITPRIKVLSCPSAQI